MFNGEFEHTLDSKGRLTLPAKFKDELANGLTISHGLDGCLWVFPKEEWDKFINKLAETPITNAKLRKFSRFMVGGATSVIPDKVGRVVLPQKLQAHVGIDREVVIVGMMRRLELWSPEKWATQQADFLEDPEELAAQIDELGIF